MTNSDPTLSSALRPLRLLLTACDAAIASVYAERGVEGVSPRFSATVIRLHHRGPLTVGELASELSVTHSAMSQTATALRRAGLVDSVPGADARTRRLSLSEAGREVVPFLEQEWRATEAAVAELESEVPYPLTQVVRDLEAALARRGFRDRLLDHLPDGW